MALPKLPAFTASMTRSAWIVWLALGGLPPASLPLVTVFPSISLVGSSASKSPRSNVWSLA